MRARKTKSSALCTCVFASSGFSDIFSLPRIFSSSTHLFCLRCALCQVSPSLLTPSSQGFRNRKQREPSLITFFLIGLRLAGGARAQVPRRHPNQPSARSCADGRTSSADHANPGNAGAGCPGRTSVLHCQATKSIQVMRRPSCLSLSFSHAHAFFPGE